jgi:serine/threonine protein kinase
MKEFYTIKSLKHKNLVEYYEAFIDVIEEDMFFCILMEYFELGDLENLMKEAKYLSLDDYLKIFKNIAEGIEFLHEFNIIHRDLKPNNIFIRYNEESKEYIVKIGDFGFFLSNDLKSKHTICGTLMFMVKIFIK